MAEDREAFRDLLDRIGQPYAPSAIVEGGDATASATPRADAALAEIGLPAIVRPGVHPRRHRRRHRRDRGRPTASGSGPACGPARSARSWSSAASSAGRRSSTRSCATPTTRASPSARWRTSTRSASTPATRSSWRRSRRCTDAVHQRLRSAALAIIRALGVEGGCNVQFALSPDSHRVRGHRGQPAGRRARRRWRRKATGYPIARVAAQIAVGRRLAEIPNVVTGTTVAAFEPALDYVVVKLPRFPFDKFPTADRIARQPDEGDRRGDGDRPDLRRGPQQGAPRPRAGRRRAAGRGPGLGRRRSTTWPPSSAGDPDDADDAVIRWIDERGEACESTRFAQRSAAPIVLRRFLAPVRRPAVAGPRAAPARRPARPTIQVATGIAPVVPRRAGAQRRPRGRGPRRPAPRLADPADAGGRGAARDGQAGRLRRSRAGDPRRRDPGRAPRRRASPSASCRATRWSTPAPPSSPRRRPTSTRRTRPPAPRPRRRRSPRPAALVIGCGPVRIGQGIEFDYCAVQAADTLRRAGWSAVMINSNPETVSTDFDASTAALLRAARPGERPERRRRRDPADGEPLLPAFVAFGGQTPLNLAAPLAAGGVPLLGSRPRGDRPGRGADPLLGPPRPARHPPARGRHGPLASRRR